MTTAQNELATVSESLKKTESQVLTQKMILKSTTEQLSEKLTKEKEELNTKHAEAITALKAK